MFAVFVKWFLTKGVWTEETEVADKVITTCAPPAAVSHAAAEGEGQTHHPEAAGGRLLRSLRAPVLLCERSRRLPTASTGETLLFSFRHVSRVSYSPDYPASQTGNTSGASGFHPRHREHRITRWRQQIPWCSSVRAKWRPTKQTGEAGAGRWKWSWGRRSWRGQTGRWRVPCVHGVFGRPAGTQRCLSGHEGVCVCCCCYYWLLHTEITVEMNTLFTDRRGGEIRKVRVWQLGVVGLSAGSAVRPRGQSFSDRWI